MIKSHGLAIYFLVDLKVMYIITFGLITIINLISSTANIHAFTDKSSMMLFNVSSKYMNVNVTSINDPIQWNCRQFSEMSDTYKFLYWMVIVNCTDSDNDPNGPNGLCNMQLLILILSLALDHHQYFLTYI